jgi:hypothetical protein
MAHHQRMKKANTEIVTPFDWQRFTARAAEASTSDKPRKPARAKKPVTVRERVERILAHRWGNPYSKPGAA